METNTSVSSRMAISMDKAPTPLQMAP